MADYSQTDPSPAPSGVNIAQADIDSSQLLNMAITELMRPPATPPAAAGVSTRNMARELELATKSRDQQNALIAKETEASRIATENEKKALADQAAAEEAQIRAIQAREQKIADGYAFFQQAFGMQPDHSSLIASVAFKIKEELPGTLEQLAEIRDMQAVGPLDNPIEWLANTIQLPNKINAYNRSADRIDGMQKAVNNALATAGAAGDLNSKTVPATTAAIADAKAKIALAQSQRLAAAADLALSRTNVEFNAKKMANDLAIFSATSTMTQVQLENSKLAYQAGIDKIRLADSHAVRLLEASKVLEKIQGTDATKAMLRRYELAVGYPANSMSIATFMTLSNVQQQNIMAIAAGSGGTNPFEYLNNMREARPGPLFSENQKVLGQTLQSYLDKIATPPQLLNDKKAADEYKARMLIAKVEQERALPYSSLLFREATPSEMLRANQVDPNSDLGKILATLSQSTGRPRTEDVVALITKQFTNPAEAGKVISEYYRKNLAYSAQAMNFQFAGIKAMDHYTVQSPVGPVFGSKERFDLMKPDRATAYAIIVTKQAEIKARGETLQEEYNEQFNRM